MLPALPVPASPQTTPDSPSSSASSPPETKRKPRGFAALKADGRLDLLRDIASRGGRGAHAAGTAHEFTPDEARHAGHKGGLASHAKKLAAKLRAADATASLYNGDEK